RPLNSFMTYRKVKQHEVIRQNPSVDNRDISRIVAQWWRSEPASVKEHYKRLADQGKREHLLKYPGYKYAPRK
ncbi:MAG: high mobility group box domain-containing protein, partial [Piptocephalis tieghemiana]